VVDWVEVLDKLRVLEEEEEGGSGGTICLAEGWEGGRRGDGWGCCGDCCGCCCCCCSCCCDGGC
jgi:hypothetical protein